MIKADLEAISVEEKRYRDQFVQALNVNGGNIEKATVKDYFLHFFSFHWKVIFKIKLFLNLLDKVN